MLPYRSPIVKREPFLFCLSSHSVNRERFLFVFTLSFMDDINENGSRFRQGGYHQHAALV